MDGRQRFCRLKTEPLLQFLHILDGDIPERLSGRSPHERAELIPNADGDAVAQRDLRLGPCKINELLFSGVAIAFMKIAGVVGNQVSDCLQSFSRSCCMIEYPPLHRHCHFVLWYCLFLFLLLFYDIRRIFDRHFCK